MRRQRSIRTVIASEAKQSSGRKFEDVASFLDRRGGCAASR
jgi:hypothetical protein